MTDKNINYKNRPKTSENNKREARERIDTVESN
jgi:hypothetical protein